MNNNKQEGPAFPIWTGDMSIEGNPGLTKREYIAIEAMKGLLSTLDGFPPTPMYEHLAKTSITLADEMLKQLEEE
jgi:hypothetical protein